MVKILPACRRRKVCSLGQEALPEEGMAAFLPGEFHGQECGGLPSMGFQRGGHNWSGGQPGLKYEKVLITKKNNVPRSLWSKRKLVWWHLSCLWHISIYLMSFQQNNQFSFSLTESTVHFISKLEHVVMETDALGCTINRPLARFVCFSFFFCFHVNYQLHVLYRGS